MKKKFVIILLGLTLCMPTHADERTEIEAFIKELDYLIEVSQGMKSRYARNGGRVRFNYDALTKQLRTTRARTADYLNSKGESINRAPPKTLNDNLIRIQ